MADKKDLDVTCPCCDSRLTIDVRTGKVLNARRPEELTAEGKPKLRAGDWDQMNEKVRGRMDDALSKFDAGLSRERTKSKDLDALFEKLSDKATRGEDLDDDEDAS